MPDGWEWKKLGDVCNLLNGYAFKAKDYVEFSDTVLIRMGNIRPNGEFDAEHKIQYLPNKYSSELTNYILNDGDLIIAMTDMATEMKILGIPTLVKNTSSRIFMLNQRVGKLYDFKLDKINIEYLKYILSANQIKDYYKSLGGGGLQINIGKQQILSVDFPLPSLEEQKRIVAKLDILFKKIDKAIALHQKNIDEADIFMASVLNDVFVELEEKYEKKQLNQIVIFGWKNISTLEYPNLIYFSLEDIETQTGKILNYKTVNESGVKGTAVSFDDNVVLYSKLRPYLNKVIVPNLEGCATTELVVLKPKDKLDKYFLASYLRSSNIVSFLNNDSMGAKMPRTNMKTFRNLDIPLPPLQNQQKVVAYLDEISNKMEKIKQIQKEKMQSLKELKASILDKAFKGEL